MISFEEAKKLIREGKFFDVKLINFDINQLDIEVTTDSHDSNSFENIYTYTTQKTLLHIAIECKNKKAIIGLIKNGANKKIDVEKTEKRVQRQAISGNSFWGAAEWGEWQDWEPSITTLSTVQLAEDTKHPEIISMIKDGVLPEDGLEEEKLPPPSPIEKKSKTKKKNATSELEKSENKLKIYSDKFETLYDQTKPVENIGRGCHYSILRAKDKTSYDPNAVFDFAVIWDEDHDERIIVVLEKLYAEGKLKKYIIVGERKGMFTAILNPSASQKYSNKLPKFLDAENDQWTTSELTLNNVGNGALIQDGKDAAEKYIHSIIEKWKLGKKTLKMKKTAAPVKTAVDEKRLEKKLITELIEAIKVNDKEEVKRILKSGIKNINAIDESGDNATPLHWAAKHASKEIINLLIGAGADPCKSDVMLQTPINWATEAGRQDIAKFLAAQIVSTDESVNAEDTLVELKINQNQGKIVKKQGKKDDRKVSMYGFPDKVQAQKIEIGWQKKVVTKFFKIGKPLREGTQSLRIYQHLVDQIEAPNKPALRIDNCHRRSLIIALSKILSEHKGMPNLIFKLGETLIKFIPADSTGTKRQIGNFKMEIPGCYDIAYGEGCTKRLIYLCETRWDSPGDKQRRKKILLELISTRLQQLKPFSHQDLNKYGNIRILDEEEGDFSNENVSSKVHFLNGLIMLVTTVEVLVRLYRDKNGKVFPYSDQNGIKSDSFPVAIAQARSLFLLFTGQITLEDFFGESKRPDYNSEQHRAYYGAVTGKGIIDHIKTLFDKLLAINEKYNESIGNAKFWQDLKTEYLQDNKDGYLVEGKSRMYFDLKNIYGSGSESDAESSDYSSDEELEVTEFKAK